MKKLIFSSMFFLWSSLAIAEPYSIGAILPLSGDSALGGQACLNGMLLAQRKLDATDKNNQIKVISENNEGTPAKTVSAYKKLCTHDEIKAVVAWEDSAGLVLAPMTERDEILLAVTGGDKSIVKNRKHAFLYWLMLDTETEAIAAEIRRLGYKKIARVVTQHPGTLFMKAELDRLTKEEVSYVVDEEVLPESRDFRSEILKIKAQGDVDAVIAFLWYGQVGLFAKQKKALGVSGTIVGSDIYEDETELKLAEGALEGAWFPQIADPLPTFKQEYEAAFPGASIFSAGNCYDIVMLIAKAREEKKDPSEYFETVRNFSGALGIVSTSGDHRFIFPLLIRGVYQGKFHTIHR